jgi:hypothetical protein
MGRYWGSGRRTVEQTRSIEIGALQRAGYFAAPKQGWWIWQRKDEITGSARIDWNGDQLRIRDQAIDLARAPCRFGGYRLWFRCSCARHVSTLYSPSGRPWACRHCYRLTYATRQAIPRDRHLMRAQGIRQRLGGSRNMLDPFPPKPKGMHWRRYDRMRDVHDQASNLYLGLAAEWVEKLRLGRAPSL